MYAHRKSLHCNPYMPPCSKYTGYFTRNNIKITHVPFISSLCMCNQPYVSSKSIITTWKRAWISNYVYQIGKNTCVVSFLVHHVSIHVRQVVCPANYTYSLKTNKLETAVQGSLPHLIFVCSSIHVEQQPWSVVTKNLVQQPLTCMECSVHFGYAVTIM